MYNESNHTVTSTQPSQLVVSTTPASSYQDNHEPWFFWLQIILISALMICVVVGNLMVIYCLFTIKELQTVTGVFLTNLAVTDLGVGLISLPLALASSIESLLIYRSWFCTLQGMAIVLFTIASLLTLGLLSLAKYINVVHSAQRRIDKRHAKYSIVGIWVVAAVFAIAPAFGLSTYTYNGQGGHQCAPYEASVPGYIYIGLLLTIGIVVPCTTMLYCYYKLYNMAHLHIRRMRINDTEGGNHFRQRLSSVESHLINTLIIMVIALFICWMPSLIFYILSFTTSLSSKKFDTFVLLCNFANSVVNPILYAMRQNDFQRGFRQLMRRFCSSKPDQR